MSFSLIWLPLTLKSAGLKVAVVPGWENRGRGDIGPVKGIICHHTAGPKAGNMPSLRIVTEGRSDLPGPLAQLCLGRDGTFYVVAAGRANHAGAGEWQHLTNGNTHFIGIEAENTGEKTGPRSDFPWPEVQMEAYRRGVAAILTKIGQQAIMCVGHKEYALPTGRKSDPNFDMNVFRLDVAALMNGTAPAPNLIPPIEPPSQPGAPVGRPTLRRGASGDLVRQLQAKLGMTADGEFGPKTEAILRAFQRERGMVPDGIAGPKTWVALDGA